MERHARLAVLLVNTLAVDEARGRGSAAPPDGPSRLAALGEALAEAGFPTAALTPADADRLAAATRSLRPVFGAGTPVADLNDLLVRQAAVPHLHGDPPALAFHAPGASPTDAWIADAATALAMVIGVGQGARLRTCEAGGCDLAFFDRTRNASRRFCGLSCQNRAKATAYRARRANTKS
ncbi:CGNR zinc finger domain-containing protein [Nonomuraea sp. NBC_01738]|uniref:CGNR zinc finger domain-containing protein n=1 Tax=Nonomuraea sp. NBC_01738 TaxID=2976003 RepID=UPI002E14BE14|nr:CGNR zinc finger domain-containing protein [Nonomuraea sp. NBC_01738]